MEQTSDDADWKAMKQLMKQTKGQGAEAAWLAKIQFFSGLMRKASKGSSRKSQTGHRGWESEAGAPEDEAPRPPVK